MLPFNPWIEKKIRMTKRVKAAGKWGAFVAARDRYRLEHPDETNVETIYEAAYKEVMADAEIVVW